MVGALRVKKLNNMNQFMNPIYVQGSHWLEKYLNLEGFLVPASLYLQKIYRRRVDYLRDNTAKGLLTTTTTTKLNLS